MFPVPYYFPFRRGAFGPLLACGAILVAYVADNEELIYILVPHPTPAGASNRIARLCRADGYALRSKAFLSFPPAGNEVTRGKCKPHWRQILRFVSKQRQLQVVPISAAIYAPVTMLEASLARNSTTAAISSGLPRRFRAVRPRICSFTLGISRAALLMEVGT